MRRLATRILALDHGTKRTGFAVSSDLKLIDQQRECDVVEPCEVSSRRTGEAMLASLSWWA